MLISVERCDNAGVCTARFSLRLTQFETPASQLAEDCRLVPLNSWHDRRTNVMPSVTESDTFQT